MVLFARMLRETCFPPPALQAPSQRHARLLPQSSFPRALSHKTKLPILATYLGAREMNDGRPDASFSDSSPNALEFVAKDYY